MTRTNNSSQGMVQAGNIPRLLLGIGWAVIGLAIALRFLAARGIDFPGREFVQVLLTLLGLCIGGEALHLRFKLPWSSCIDESAGIFVALAGALTALLLLIVGGSELLRWELLGGAALLSVTAIIQYHVQLGHRDESPLATVFVFAASMMPFTASYALDPEWDSWIMVLNVVAGVGWAATILVALTPFFRACAASLFILFHFLGIFSAATSVGVQNYQAPWVVTVSYIHVYRDYLNFIYMINAYHFYSPDPGPSQLLWFRVEYSNDKHLWVKIPQREDYPARLQFQRRLGLTASTHEVSNDTPPEVMHQLENYRKKQVQDRPELTPLLLDPYVMRAYQPFYQKPSAYSAWMLSNYARYVAIHFPYRDEDGNPDPDVEVRSVKVYKLSHFIMSAKDVADGGNPEDAIRYFPVFEGEFDREGTLLEDDGFRYYVMPPTWIVDTPSNRALFPRGWTPKEAELETPSGKVRHLLMDRMAIHAELSSANRDKPKPATP